jgi:hypothetical protein
MISTIWLKSLKYKWRCSMENSERVENYIESESERESGHVDTRSANFECENKDSNLGCDLGIDVAG